MLKKLTLIFISLLLIINTGFAGTLEELQTNETTANTALQNHNNYTNSQTAQEEAEIAQTEAQTAQTEAQTAQTEAINDISDIGRDNATEEQRNTLNDAVTASQEATALVAETTIAVEETTALVAETTNAAEEATNSCNTECQNANTETLENNAKAAHNAKCTESGDCIDKSTFSIHVGDSGLGLGGSTLIENTTKQTINNILGTIIQKLMIGLGSLSLLIMTIGSGYMIIFHGQDELLSKGKYIFMSGIIALVVALSSYYIVSLLRYLLYSGT